MLRSRNYQPPLSNILVSKRITPINPEESPVQNKRKQNHSYAPKEESTRKIPAEESQAEEEKRKTSTSLSHRIHIRAHDRALLNSNTKEEAKIKVTRTD